MYLENYVLNLFLFLTRIFPGDEFNAKLAKLIFKEQNLSKLLQHFYLTRSKNNVGNNIS